jgi:hypothetical protein
MGRTGRFWRGDMGNITSELIKNTVFVFYETDTGLTFQAQLILSDYNSEEEAITAATEMAKQYYEQYKRAE